MGWSSRAVEGFLLAATVAEDDSVESARHGLAARPAAQVSGAAERLRAMDGSARRSEVRRIAAILREPPAADAQVPPRARALLAREMPRDIGRLWLAAAPPPRRGFVAAPALRDVLRRAARCSRPHDEATAARERGAGREVLARALRGRADEDRVRVLASLEPDEAGAVLALEPLVDASAPAGSSPVDGDAVMIWLADTTRRGDAKTRVVGAMLLGWSGDPDGDGRSAGWRRAGAEVRELVEAGCPA